jgi:hypothetical protein
MASFSIPVIMRTLIGLTMTMLNFIKLTLVVKMRLVGQR